MRYLPIQLQERPRLLIHGSLETEAFSSSTTSSPTHDYSNSHGSYTVRLIVTDGNGCTDSVTRTSYIFIANLNAAFSGPDTACVNTNVTFANSSTPSGLSSTWTFGDGSPSVTSSQPGITFIQPPGTYTVRLVVFDGTCPRYCHPWYSHPPWPGGQFYHFAVSLHARRRLH